MNLLDASALIAFLRGEPGQPTVEELIRSGDTMVATIVVAEVTDVLVRRLGIDAERAGAALAELTGDRVRTRSLDLEIATRAGEIRSRRYHRTKRPLSMADCVVIATAGEGDSIVSTDVGLLAAAALEGIGTVPLDR